MNNLVNGSSQLRFGADPRLRLKSKLDQLRATIGDACASAGRKESDVRVLAVTKTVPAEILRHAYVIGVRDFAENKVQEARNKLETLGDLPIRWCMIGHLQSNKAKHVARFASEFHALDSLRLASTLNQQLIEDDRTLDVYVQVNTAGEGSPYGLHPEALDAFVDALPAFDRLKPRGFMTLATASSDRSRVRACFHLLRVLRDRVVTRHPAFSGLSMGMSGDFEDAIKEGASVVRLGQALFGARPTPNSLYWPEDQYSKHVLNSTSASVFSPAPTLQPLAKDLGE